MKQGNQTNRMRSIARSINLGFWLRELFHFLMLDVLLIALVLGVFFMQAEKQVPDGVEIIDRYFVDIAHWETLRYAVKTESGVETYLLIEYLSPWQPAAIVVLVVEGCMLFGSLFSTNRVRRRMKPLNEIAIRTEELANQTGAAASAVNLSGIEQAISNLNPEAPDARIQTGDKELQSLEIAINNLLARMRESHQQQERFVSDASHELRTPIAVIQGYVNMLDRWGKDDEQILKESIEALKNESEHMKTLIEQLLFLARGDSGRQTLHWEVFDLTETVQEVMEESEMIDKHHLYQFVADCPEPVMINGDLAMIKQSVRIFVQNAAKYSGAGELITLRVGKTEIDRTGGMPASCPYYSVQDEGVGMASSEVTHVFERFYRSDGARNSAQGGTGLGLSIAKWIVDAHGGQIEVLSRPDFGTRITVKLNTAIPAQAENPQTESR